MRKGVVEGVSFHDTFWGPGDISLLWREPLLRMERNFVKENRASRINFIPFVGLRGSPFRWKGCLGE